MSCPRPKTQVRLLERLRARARELKAWTYALYGAYRDPRVPWYARVFALCVVAYAFSPIDLIPDFVPVLGYLDDLILIPLGIALAIRMIPPEVLHEHRERGRVLAAEGKPVNRAAAVVIVLIWVAMAAGALLLVRRLIRRIGRLTVSIVYESRATTGSCRPGPSLTSALVPPGWAWPAVRRTHLTTRAITATIAHSPTRASHIMRTENKKPRPKMDRGSLLTASQRFSTCRGWGAGAAGFSFSGMSVISASVVRIMAAMEAAFSSAPRVTLAGSMIRSWHHVVVVLAHDVEADVACCSVPSARGGRSR